MIKYFTVNDDFEFIIKQFYPDVKNIKQISTGWTNFVFKAKIKRKWWIFRFPRNSFFSKVLYKEATVCALLQQESLNVKIPKLKILHFKHKPFSMHEFIHGTPLTHCKLSNKQMQIVINQICLFMSQLQKVFLPIKLPFASQFLKDLSRVSNNDYDLSKHDHLNELEKKEKVFSHGDLNPGNILIKDGNVVGVLDFAFACSSTPLNDLARLVERLPKKHKDMFIDEYEKFFQVKIDANSLNELVSMWEYVESQYIEYIKKNHPDIQLPKY